MFLLACSWDCWRSMNLSVHSPRTSLEPCIGGRQERAALQKEKYGWCIHESCTKHGESNNCQQTLSVSWVAAHGVVVVENSCWAAGKFSARKLETTQIQRQMKKGKKAIELAEAGRNIFDSNGRFNVYWDDVSTFNSSVSRVEKNISAALLLSLISGTYSKLLTRSVSTLRPKFSILHWSLRTLGIICANRLENKWNLSTGVSVVSA